MNAGTVSTGPVYCEKCEDPSVEVTLEDLGCCGRLHVILTCESRVCGYVKDVGPRVVNRYE